MSNNKQLTLQAKLSHTVSLSSENGAATINFDLNRVKMTLEQKQVVLKLFRQNPVAVITQGDHTHAMEKGKSGPASKYLDAEEFESIRQLGVRLGTEGELAAAQCDFCLHCVKLEARPELAQQIE